MAVFEDEFKKIKTDRRVNNGGARKGAGRPLSLQNKMVLDHMNEEIVVKEYSYGQIRRVKKKRLEALLDRLFIMGIKDRNIRAIKAYLDITSGKSRIIRDKPVRKKTPKQIYCPALALAGMEYEKLKS